MLRTFTDRLRTRPVAVRKALGPTGREDGDGSQRDPLWSGRRTKVSFDNPDLDVSLFFTLARATARGASLGESIVAAPRCGRPIRSPGRRPGRGWRPLRSGTLGVARTMRASLRSIGERVEERLPGWPHRQWDRRSGQRLEPAESRVHMSCVAPRTLRADVVPVNGGRALVPVLMQDVRILGVPMSVHEGQRASPSARDGPAQLLPPGGRSRR